MKKKKNVIIWSVVVVVLLLVAGSWFFLKKEKPQGFDIVCTTSVKDSVQLTVTATGEIQPVYKIDVGTQVSGIVEKIYVDFNATVSKGQLLAELDKSTLLEQVRQSEATLSDAESNLKFISQNYERVKQLYDKNAATKEAYEDATNQLIQAKNKVTTSKSNLQKAQVNLSYAKIYSPISGVVLNKAVEEGQTVAASFSTPTLFTIANDLKQMQVEADVDEADIGRVKVGQPVTFTVDAFPDDVFTGIVKQVRLEPTITSNVVTYTVIIDAPNPQEKLFPGMTAAVTIITKNQYGIVIPMQAIYFTPDEKEKKELQKQNITVQDDFVSQEELTNSLKEVDKKSIWVINGNELKRKTVKIGVNDGVKVLVDSGIKEGESVVLSLSEKKGMKEEPSSSGLKMGPPERKKR